MTLEAAGFKWTYRPEKQTSSHTGKMELITSSIMTNEQIEQKKQQLKQLAEEAQQLKNELIEAGAWPLSDDELDKAAGGISGRDGDLLHSERIRFQMNHPSFPQISKQYYI